MNKDCCLIIFAKYPDKGKVKSRLSGYLDEDIVARLYICFIEDLLERLTKGDFPFMIACHPGEKKGDFARKFGDAFSYMPQIGEDLGERMYNAFCHCFSEGFRSVVIIGSDSPDLPLRIIKDAFQALDTHAAVIGPACDGGYYLIGFSRDDLFPDVFEGMAWGTDDVFRKTVHLLKNAGIRHCILPVWRDMDRPEDIFALLKDNRKTDFATSRTIAYLKKLGFTESS